MSEGVSRRDLALGMVFAATAGIAYARLPRQRVVALPVGSLRAAVPERVDGWTAVPDSSFVLPPEDERKAAAIYEDQVMRSYGAGDAAPIMLLLAYDRSQSGMLMVHRPESCYPGSGFTIVEERDVAIPLAPGVMVPGRFLSTVRGARTEQVLYWTRLGRRFPVSWDDQRWSIARQNLQGLVPDGALVRLSVIDPDLRGALTTLTRFAAALFGASGAAGRAVLTGPVSG